VDPARRRRVKRTMGLEGMALHRSVAQTRQYGNITPTRSRVLETI
jgi:hypothetical protein